jgi:hypothetical protein
LVLDGGDPFDEATMIDDDEAPQLAERPLPGHELGDGHVEPGPAPSTGAVPVGSGSGSSAGSQSTS